MKRTVRASLYFSAAALFLLGITGQTLFSQTQPYQRRAAAPRTGQTSRPPASTPARPVASTRPVAGPVALVDISYVFKNHSGFNGAMEQMKNEVKAFEEQFRARQQALAKERDRMNQFNPGSQNYVSLERSIADQAAKLQVDMQLKKKEFLEREAKLYYQVYMEVTEAIREYADMNRISLVLRHNGDKIDPNDRASVLQGVNRAIVYQRGLDITRPILDRVNRKRMATRPSTNGRPPRTN